MKQPRHIVFGTAGHVDHGKSALVRALTGTDPDRWAEEKAREMTIDLGFAFLALPGGEEPAAIVDVPGHEMFVRNMVTGASGIDAAIFVVAADEGVMPQSLEHLDVLVSLGVSAGLVALTKADRAAPETIAESTVQIRQLVKGTFLEGAPIMPVSSVTRAGLPELIEALAKIADQVAPRPATGLYRHPIDRVFTMKGAGTVITGTVISGSLKAGEKVELLPQGRILRVRGLQVHNAPAQEIFAGQRAAVNLADIETEALGRGDVLVEPGAMRPALMLDARVNLSGRAPRALAPRARVRVHHGTREVMARVVLLEADELRPGDSTLCQLRLEAPLVAAKGDRFVLRSYSPMLVIGGGVVIDAHPPKRKRASGGGDIAEQEALPAKELVADMLERAGARGLTAGEMQRRADLPEAELRAILEALRSEEHALPARRDIWLSAGAVKEIEAGLIAALADYHKREPVFAYAPLNEIVGGAAPGVEAKEAVRLALEALAERRQVEIAGNRIRLAGYAPRWAGKEAAIKESILGELLRAGLAAPSVKELAGRARAKEAECKRVLEALVEGGQVGALPGEIFLHAQVAQKCRQAVADFIRQKGRLNIAQARELLGASRKYLLPFLEQMDREGLTRREGDWRTAGPKAKG